MARTVFYSWQLDSPRETNRNFIERALERAVKAVARSLDAYVAPRIDKDTAGEPGSPEIFSTICNKIPNCTAFVADITLVGETRRGHATPNPNVLVEFGLALAAPGRRSIITVLNAEFGGPDRLPFNLRHQRAGIIYRLKEDSDEEERSVAAKRLTRDLEKALRLVLEKAGPAGQLSDEAFDVARQLSTSSEFGLRGSDANSVSEWSGIWGVSEEAARAVIDELTSLGYLEPLGIAGGDKWRVTLLFFTDLDAAFQDWRPLEDARTVARMLVEGERRQLRLEKVAEELSWAPRRLNPAVSFLLQMSLVDHSRQTGAHPFRVASIIETGDTRNWVRQKPGMVETRAGLGSRRAL